MIFDVKGPGIINHIWITMGPEPAGLSRNDIIIRMYWDGQEYPSVESPIGPFFRTGLERILPVHFSTIIGNANRWYGAGQLFCHAL